MGCECIEHCGIHVFEDICIVEVVDKLNRPVPPGSLGHKCLLTNLYNKTQPLIRYEISDMLTKSTEPCSCGRPFPLIKQIAGRSEDILILKDGQGRDIAIPPVVLGARIESLLEVAEYEIRHNPEHIRLKVAPRCSSYHHQSVRHRDRHSLAAIIVGLKATQAMEPVSPMWCSSTGLKNEAPASGRAPVGVFHLSGT